MQNYRYAKWDIKSVEASHHFNNSSISSFNPSILFLKHVFRLGFFFFLIYNLSKIKASHFLLSTDFIFLIKFWQLATQHLTLYRHIKLC